MKHPTDEAIITYLYKEAGADEVSAIEKHMSECGDCAHKIEGIRQTILNIDQMDDNKTPVFLEEKIAGFFDKLSGIEAQSIKIQAKGNNEFNSGLKAQNYDYENEEEIIKAGMVNINSDFKDNNAGRDQNQNDILTLPELAAYLKLPAESIYALLDEIPHLQLAGQLRFRRNSIEKWLDSREKKPVQKKAARRDFDDSFKLWQNVI